MAVKRQKTRRLKLIIAVPLTVIAVIGAWIGTAPRLQTYREHSALTREAKRLHLADAPLKDTGFDNEHFGCLNDLVAVGCPSHPKLMGTYDVKQTTLSTEILQLRQALTAAGYVVHYNPADASGLSNITGSSGSYTIEINLQYRHQTANSNPATPVDGIDFTLRNDSVTDY